MAANNLDVNDVARLARLELTPEELKTYGAQLKQVLAYIDKLNEVDVTGVDPLAHPIPMTNVTRPDEPSPSLSQDEALSNAPAQLNGLFLVPKIVE